MILIVLTSTVALLLTVHLATVALYLKRLRSGSDEATRTEMPGIGLPRITLLRPVCGADPFDAETLASSFTLDWPDYEIIFCAPSETDASVPLVRDLMARYPHVQAQLLCGQHRITGNPKLDNLWKGWKAAQSDWVCMADSNLLLPRDYLRRLATAWTAQTGLVSSPPTGTRPEGLAGSLECAFLNSNQARMQFAADSFGHGFAQGKTLFWNRAMLQRAGGLRALGRELAEDVCATKLTQNEGLRVSLPHLPFAQPIGQRAFGDVWARQMRWSRVRRDGFPLMFLGEIINGAVLPLILSAVALVAGGLSLWWLAGFALIWWGAEVVLMTRAGWPCSPRDILALPMRDALITAIWFGTFARRDIAWRGHAMEAPARTAHTTARTEPASHAGA